MKQFYFALLMITALFRGLLAQNNNLVIYSQDGLKFTVILNGVRQNPQPETNVKVTALNAPNYQVKIIFADNIPNLDQNTYLMNGGEITRDFEYSYSIKNVNGKYKLRFNSASPILPASNNIDAQQTIIVYSPIAAAETNTMTTTTTTTSSTGANTNDGSIGVNMSAPGMNINVTNNGTLPNNSSTTTTSYSTTTTTTTTAGNINGGAPVSANGYVLAGYNGIYGCPYPMSPSDFASAKETVKSEGFDESRLTIAKQIIGSNCLLCSQIKELMQLMSFEKTKLELAKFSWHHNLDRGNYYKLNDAFSFKSSIEELNQYVQGH